MVVAAKGTPRRADRTTEQEYRVLASLVAQGLQQKEIAQRIGLSLQGVRYRTCKLYARAGIQRHSGATFMRISLVKWAIQFVQGG